MVSHYSQLNLKRRGGRGGESEQLVEIRFDWEQWVRQRSRN